MACPGPEDSKPSGEGEMRGMGGSGGKGEKGKKEMGKEETGGA